MTLRFEDDEKNYWNWFPVDSGDPNQIRFDEKLKKIRSVINDLFKHHEAKEPPLPFYTPHGLDHFKAVEDNIHLLIYKDNFTKLTKAERYFLLGSAWLHDVGMLTSILPEDSTYPNNFDPKDIRETHHKRSEKFIIENWPSCGIEEHEAPGFSLLARYHRRREPIGTCKEKLETKYGTIRVRLLAAYLRLADALEIDQTRTPASAYAICLSYDIPEESKIHWIKSKFVLAIDVDPEKHTISINLRNPFFKIPEDMRDKKIENRIENIH